MAFKLFNHLANHGINVDIILQSIGRDGTKDISFTVDEDKVDEAIEVMENHRKTSLICDKIDVNKNVAKVIPHLEKADELARTELMEKLEKILMGK